MATLTNLVATRYISIYYTWNVDGFSLVVIVTVAASSILSCEQRDINSFLLFLADLLGNGTLCGSDILLFEYSINRGQCNGSILE